MLLCLAGACSSLFRAILREGVNKMNEILKALQARIKGDYPDGKIDETDQGALVLSVEHDEEGKVFLEFPEPVLWAAFTAEQAMDVGKALIEHALLACIKEKGAPK